MKIYAKLVAAISGWYTFSVAAFLLLAFLLQTVESGGIFLQQLLLR